MVRAMCGVHFIDRRRSTDLVSMLGFNETIDQLAMANSVHWYGHVLRRDDGHVLRRDVDVECHGKNERPKRKRQVEEESMQDGFIKKDALCQSKWSVVVDQPNYH